MLAANRDVTVEFNAGSGINLDISGWDVVDVHLVSPSGAITFNGTNDAGAVQGVTDGNYITATNWTIVQGVIQGSGTAATTIATTGIIRFTQPSRFLQLTGSTVTATKVIIYYSKIN